MTVKELIDKLVLVEDTEYKEFQAADVLKKNVLQWAKYGLKK